MGRPQAHRGKRPYHIFKGKELALKRNSQGWAILTITMEKFINGLDQGAVTRGRLTEDPLLTEAEKREYRSVSGCLQWASTQCRPEIAPAISLSNQGHDTTITSLKNLYEALSYLKQTPKQGLTMQDVPLNRDTFIIAYSDASWANAARSGSQIG